MLIDDFVPVAATVATTNAWLLACGADIARSAAHATAPTDTVNVGPIRTRSESLVMPILWAPRGPNALRELQGDLQTSPLDPTSTHLSLSASCVVAVEPLGRRIQEQSARRAAEQSVRRFLGRLAGELEFRSAAGAPGDQ